MNNRVDVNFHNDIKTNVFEKYLKPIMKKRIMVFDKKNNRILETIDYSLLLFDSNMNIYKSINGNIQKVDNPDFEAVQIEKPLN